MSITDELREFAEKNECKSYCKLLTAIADRIDAEHEKAIRELNNLADTCVLLPKDADGEYIRIGDVMEWPTTGETFEVVGIGDGVLFYVEYDEKRADWTGASTKRHYHAPTVEDVLREFVQEFIDFATCIDDHEVTDAIEQYAKRLKLAEGEGE